MTGPATRIPRLDVSRLRGRIVGMGSLYVLVCAALAAFAAAPIYGVLVHGAQGAPAYLRVAVAGVAGAFLVAAVARVLRWPAWATVLGAAGLFLVLSAAVAVPPDPTPTGVLDSLRATATGVTTGFKDLLTVDLPVGSYRDLLVPVLAVLFAGTLGALTLAWRPDALSTWATVPAIAMSAFGLLFGAPVASATIRLGSLAVPAPRELFVGALVLMVSVAWLSWRSRELRRAALLRAADASGVRVARRGSAAGARRAALAATMVVVSVVAGSALTPLVAEGRTREVLRSATGPEEVIRRSVSPLSDYRTHFADASFSRPLFSVDAVSGPMPDRIRIATLTDYDGTEYRVAADGGLFTRIADAREPDPGTPSTVRIDIAGLRGIWLPTFGSLERVDFTRSKDAGGLADAFYYSAATAGAVDTATLHAGDVYDLTATVAAPRALESLQQSGARPAVALPQSVTDWIARQRVAHDGTGLKTLIDRLRARGYLSHALAVPETGAAWEKPLGAGYVFQPSTAGHSLARVDALFRALLDRANQAAAAPAAGGASADASLVAAVGDDEQFAVAASLLAQALGFPARVVVGVRLSGNDLPACRGGVCTGGDLSAWTEVQDRDGTWVAIDATPQHENGLDATTLRERDPENPTEVRPETAHEVVPPDPAQHDAANSDAQRDDGPDFEPLWAALRIAGAGALVLAILTGPFLAVIAMKAGRRRGRRHAAETRSRFSGGWDEFVDTAVDYGMPRPGVRTRTEVAASLIPTAGATALATDADRAVFSDAQPDAADAAAFWSIVDAERRALAARHSVWRRLRAAVSLSSFVRPRRTAPDPRGDDAETRRPTT